MHKYSCRDCRIRERCIDENDSAAHIKTMIRTAFGARTDTVSMWAILQKSCLLVQEDEARQRKVNQESLLARRLREAREVQEEVDQTSGEEGGEAADQFEPTPSMTITPDPATTVGFDSDDDAPIFFDVPAYVEPASEAEEFRIEAGDAPGTRPMDAAQFEQPPGPELASLYWLIIENSRRRISLPLNGAVVLGRFDPGLTDPLDIDLTYEDRDTLSVSRRHAKIMGTNGDHVIEDLGSSNGVFIDGRQIPPGRPFPLQPDDRIAFGNLRLRYQKASTGVLRSLTANPGQLRHYLFVTHTGHSLELTPPDNLIIGRTDPEAGFVPGIDLTQEGEVAYRVSRRHARITWSNQMPYLKDLTSTFGTRLNGNRLQPGQLVRLKPGDHMSLGGCVLAYDLEA